MAKAELVKTAAQLPATIDMDALAAMPSGMEQVTAKDIIIPRLAILQALSPQLDPAKPEYIKGAERGQFIDVASEEVWSGQLELLPVYFATVYLEWAPRSSGGGLVNNYGTDATILSKCTRDENNRNQLPNGNYVAETATYFLFNLTAGGRRSFLPLSSTQLKAARQWMTKIQQQKEVNTAGVEFTPPIYWRAWTASVVPQSNAKGSWYGWKFTPGQTLAQLKNGAQLMREAVAFATEAKAGLVKGDFTAMAEEHAEDDGKKPF